MEQIKELFFENPNKEFYLSQIAKLTKIPKTSTQRILKELKKQKLILRKDKKPFPVYEANIKNTMYFFEKKQHILRKIYESNIIDYLFDQMPPNCIILFGSIQKGTYTKESDIDLYVEFPEMPLDLEKFEKRLKHKLHIQWGDLKDFNPHLANNIIMGDVLYGAKRVYNELGKVSRKPHKKNNSRPRKDKVTKRSSRDKTKDS